MNSFLTSHFSIHFFPLVSPFWIGVIAVTALLLAVFAALRSRHGMLWRLAGISLLILTLLGPSILVEEREPVEDVAAVVVDKSFSQTMGERKEITGKNLKELKKVLEEQNDLEVRIIEAPANKEYSESTNLFQALERGLSEVPEKRRAGVIFLSDGRIHDVPDNPAYDYGPLHLLVTGNRNDKDRRLIVTEAPAYGIVGNNITIRYKVHDTANTGKDTATIRVTEGTRETMLRLDPLDEEQSIEVKITRPGQNVFHIDTAALDGEISDINNSATIVVNGIRDRLRVLLVSGLPYIGERTWRNILKSDPGVDLIHFNILRKPDKQDSTPVSERSLIAFPSRELFEVKLHEMDLIIFDRFGKTPWMPERYFSNIAEFVKKGGALLITNGPEYIREQSTANSALAEILPATPGGEVIEKPFTPELAGEGKYHPVTSILDEWGTPGQLLRQIPLTVKSGKTLMEGANGLPLLVLDKAGQGRVAQLASDQIWLWAKGYGNGGPYASFLRRIIHWLMKEPQLEEDALMLSADENEILVRKRRNSGSDSDTAVIMHGPDGSETEIEFGSNENDWQEAKVQTAVPGVYSFEYNGKYRFQTIGSINPEEYEGLTATHEKIAPLIEDSGGGVYWLQHRDLPSIRMISGGKDFAGKSWLGLRDNNDFNITGVSSRTLFPAWLSVLIVLFAIITGWWREGRQ